MALNTITFNINKSGLGRPLDGYDHYSSLVYYTNSLPASKYVLYSATDLTSGTAGALYYTVSEYFRMQPKGVLYLNVAPASTSGYTYNEVETIQNFAGGKISTGGVLIDTVIATTDITALNTVCTRMLGDYQPASQFLSSTNWTGKTLGTLTDLSTLNSRYVTVVVAKDQNTAHPALGTAMGAVAAAKVQEPIFGRGKFNLASGTIMDKVGLMTGEKIEELSSSALSALKDKAYLYIMKPKSLDGSYFEDSRTCIATSSDFAVLENNRAMDKVLRLVDAALEAKIGTPVTTTAGKISEPVITDFELAVTGALEQMIRNKEISEFKVTVNPAQDILATGTLSIALDIVPVGAVRSITVTLGYAVKV